MRVNQRGEPIEETFLIFPADFDQEDLATAVLLLADHLGVEFWRTNRTKHGNTEIDLRVLPVVPQRPES